MASKYCFLYVGCADCTVLQLGDKLVMVDCHQGDTSDGQEDILDWLPADSIDVLILTHQHYDHFDGIQTLLDNGITVGEVWESPYERRRGDQSVQYDEWQEYQSLVGKLVAKGAKRYAPFRSTNIFDSIGGASFQILGPRSNINTDPGRELHDACLIVRMKKGANTILFAGDASDSALVDVRTYYDLSKYHVLHASHHGSINGAELDFVKTVNPNFTMVSTKSGVHSNVPHPTAMQRYRKHSRKAVRRLDKDGTRTISSGG